jgi:uncharacterized protein
VNSSRHREERSDVAIQKRLLDCFAALAMTILMLVAAPASAQTFPKLTGRVVDDAHILTPAEVADLTGKSQALEAKTGRQFVVATVPSLQGYPIEDYGYRLGRSWGIGQKGFDNGVILLVAPNEHKVRIEVGYGATAYVTDAMSSIIIRNAILPHFRQKPPDYGGGIEAGADQVINLMSMSPDQAEQAAAQAQQQEQAHRTSSGGALPVIFWVMIFVFIMLAKARRVAGRRYRSRGGGGISPWIVLWGLSEAARASRGGGWGGGGFGGGGGGFGGFSGGGGGFGGGGASGSW